MNWDKPAVVIDMGGHTLKAGFCCDNHPVAMFRNLLARPRNLRGPYGYNTDIYDVLIGDDAVLKGEDLDLCSPIVNGRIVQWDNIERVWHHIFYRELRVAPEDRAVMIVCSSYMPMLEKIRCANVFYETLNVPALCIQPGAVLSQYGSGLVTGCTINMGYDTCDVDPVFAGGMIRYAHMQSGFAGREMNNYIRTCLAERGIDFGYNTPYIIDDIIKNHVYVTQNSAMSRKDYQRSFKSPDGEDIDISNEAFMAGEMIFQPDLVLGEKAPFKSLTETIMRSITKCDTDLRPELFSGIVMAGSLSMIPGVGDRVKKEVAEAMSKMVVRGVAPTTDKPEKALNVLTSTESNVLAWMGGAIFASIPEAERMWITRKQYDDHGVRLIRNRFM